MKSFMAMAVLALVVTGCAASSAPGIQLAVTQKGLSWLGSTAREMLVQKMKTLSIPEFDFDQDHVSGSLKEITCENLVVGDMAVTVDPQMGVSGELSGVGIKCSASWAYRTDFWPHIKGHGDVAVTVSGSSAAVSVGMGAKNGHPTVSADHCASDIDISYLHFHGGLSGWILNLFHKLIERHIEDSIDSALCKEVSTLINVDANQVMSTYNPMVSMALKAPYNISEIDFSLTSDPVGTDFISGYLHGEVYNLAAHTEAPFAPKALPKLDVASVTSHMAELAISPYVAMTASYVYRTAGLLDYTVTSAEVPPQVPIKLSTDTFADWAPQMAKQYPSTPMNLRVSVQADPTIELGGGDCNITAPVQLVFIVAPNDTAPLEAFSLTCPLKVDASVAVNNTSSVTIKPQLLFLDCPVTLQWSKMGTVNADMIRAFVGAILGSVAVPMANKALAPGFPLPTVDGLSFQNMQLAFTDAYLQVLTDVSYTPTTAAAVTEQRSAQPVARMLRHTNLRV